MSKFRKAALVAACTSIGLASCGGGGDDAPMAEMPAAPNVVTFTAQDFMFEGPAEIPAGLTTVRMVSAGQQLHHITIVKLEDGKTMADLQAALAAPPQGPPPSWLKPVGGPNPPVPGGESSATLVLEAGNYALMCFVDTPDHVPHFAKGMVKPLTVTAGAADAHPMLPAGDVTIALKDYAFTIDKPLTAGHHTFRIVNEGPQEHEIFLARFLEGKTMADLSAWAETFAGPPPVVAMGGISGISTGREANFDAELVAGNYVFLCFVPDMNDAKPHLMHGMVHEFSIQ